MAGKMVTSHRATISKRKAHRLLKISIQWPGFGKCFKNRRHRCKHSIRCGHAEADYHYRYGTEPQVCVCAHANAAVRIAKLHGVLKSAARNPIPTEPL